MAEFTEAPAAPSTPTELLTNQDLIEEPFVNKFWGPALLGGLAFLGVCVSNWYTRRPMFVGIQKHLVLTAGGAGLGKYVEDYRAGYLAERDAVLRHYVELHPDDFPPFERKKYGEVLEPWVPIR